jgi:hypothetical protein
VTIIYRYFLSYSLFYFAIRMWKRLFDFLPVIENNRTTIEIFMFFITSLLFGINLKLERETNDSYLNHIYLMLCLIVSNVIYWNVYAYIIDYEYLSLFDVSMFGYVVLGAIGVTISFILLRISKRLS